MLAATQVSRPLVPSRPQGPLGVIDRYRLVRVLGRGGMGIVYEAWDSRLQREVALKVMAPCSGDHVEQVHARMLREARVMASLSHPNVVAAYDVGVAGGQVFVAMQLVRGVTLRTWAEATHTLVEKLRVLIAAGRGLVAAHTAQIVHRDFKPDNVLIGPTGIAQVTDFGIARRLDLEEAGSRSGRIDPLAETRLTQTGALLGTPAYMSPEQALGLTPTAAADQFSFCVTAWELCAGQRPFAGATVAAVIGNIVSGDILPAPAEATWPARLRRALRRGLAVSPTDRYLHLDDLLAELQAVLRPPRVKHALWISSATALLAIGTAALFELQPAPAVAIAPVVVPEVASSDGAVPATRGMTVTAIEEVAPVVAAPVAVAPRTVDRRPAATARRPPATERVRVTSSEPPPSAPTPAEDLANARRLAAIELDLVDGIRVNRRLLPDDMAGYPAAYEHARATILHGDLDAATDELVGLRQRIDAVRIDAAFINTKATRVGARVARVVLSPSQATLVQAKLEAATAAAADDRFGDANRVLTDVDRLVGSGE